MHFKNYNSLRRLQAKTLFSHNILVNALLIKESQLYCMDLPVRWNGKVFAEQAHKKFWVLLLRALDLSDAGERTERARISFSPEHHHLIWDDVYGNILYQYKDTQD